MPGLTAPDLLQIHAELTRQIDRAPRNSAVEAKARAVRALVARLALRNAQQLAAGVDPLEAVRRVVALAAEATGDWPAVVAAVHQAGDRRHTATN